VVAASIAIAQIPSLDSCRFSAADGIKTAGDVSQFVLPPTAGGPTSGNRLGQGALQFGESLAVTLGGFDERLLAA